MNQTSENSKESAWQLRLSGFGTALVRVLATKVTRWIVILATVGAIGYLLYGMVWNNLMQPVALPPGVTKENPNLNTSVLKLISDQRVTRVQAVQSPFAVEGIFKPEQAAGK